MIIVPKIVFDVAAGAGAGAVAVVYVAAWFLDVDVEFAVDGFVFFDFGSFWWRRLFRHWSHLLGGGLG